MAFLASSRSSERVLARIGAVVERKRWCVRERPIPRELGDTNIHGALSGIVARIFFG
jgi:hypothetical protein